MASEDLYGKQVWIRRSDGSYEVATVDEVHHDTDSVEVIWSDGDEEILTKEVPFETIFELNPDLKNEDRFRNDSPPNWPSLFSKPLAAPFHARAPKVVASVPGTATSSAKAALSSNLRTRSLNNSANKDFHKNRSTTSDNAISSSYLLPVLPYRRNSLGQPPSFHKSDEYYKHHHSQPSRSKVARSMSKDTLQRALSTSKSPAIARLSNRATSSPHARHGNTSARTSSERHKSYLRTSKLAYDRP